MELSKGRKNARRIIWEFLHTWLGRGSLVLALINISLGLFLALSHAAIIYTWFGYVVVVVFAYFVAETTGKCKKDYGSIVTPSSKGHSEKKTRKYVYMVKDSKDNGTFSRYSLNNPAFEH